MEINCKEHFSVFPIVRVPFEVKSEWFNGKCEVLSYELYVFVGTKVRALFKGLRAGICLIFIRFYFWQIESRESHGGN